MSHAAIVCREYGLPAVVGTGRATALIKTGQTIRVDGSTGVVSHPRTGRWAPPAAGGASPGGRRRVRRQEREPRRAACRRHPRAARVRGRRGVPGGFVGTGLDKMIAAALPHGYEHAAKTIARRCASRAARRAARRAGRAVREARRAAGRGALERDRRGQRRGDVRGPAGDLPLGARNRRALRGRTGLLGEPVHRPRASPTASTSAQPTPRWASPSRRWSTQRRRRPLHLQPGDRRPEHGRRQRAAGASASRSSAARPTRTTTSSAR